MPRLYHHRPDRRGSLLLSALVLIALMTVGVMAYFDWTFTEVKASRAYAEQSQTRHAAESAVERLRVLLTGTPDELQRAGGLYSNPAVFRGMALTDSDAARERCRVTVVAPAMERGEHAGVRFGLENESSKLNLNTLLSIEDALGVDPTRPGSTSAEGGSPTPARDRLMALPSMTEAIADAILDWIDEDDIARPLGAEMTHYAALTPPYEPQNGPLESLEQLLLVRDITPELLFGADLNRDLVIDAAEAQSPQAGAIMDGEGSMLRGWSAYLTIASAEAERTPTGDPKIDLNQEDLEELHQQLESVLGRAEANFIVAYRQGGPESDDPLGDPAGGGQSDAAGGPATATVPAASIQIDFEQPGAVTIGSLLDLVGVKTRVVQANDTDRQTVDAAFPADRAAMSSYLPKLLENCTVYTAASGDAAIVPGRLNINQAPRALLRSIPGMPPTAVETIINTRSLEYDTSRPDRQHATWLLTEGYVTLDEMREMGPYVTAGGDIYRAQIIGFFDEGGPRSRLDVLIDASGAMPSVLRKQDMTPLGGGMTAGELGAITQEMNPEEN